MWLLLVLLSTVAIDARVTFDKSEVLDNVDLHGTNSAAFRCSSGCRVYAVTESDSLVIVDGKGRVRETVIEDIANVFELTGGDYHLMNTGPADPVFILYAVEKGSASYDTYVVFVGGGSPQWIEADRDSTFIASTGAVNFWSFTGFEDGDPLPSVYAAGADSIDSCRPVFTTSSAASLSKTAFAINSPLATISFKGGSGKWGAGAGKFVLASGDAAQSSMALDSIAVYVSPGYVGCPSVGDSLYSLAPPISQINANVTLARAEGLTVAINGDYSIANQADALALTVNSDAMKLFGKNVISKTYNDTNFNIKLDWTEKKESKDGFTMQIDISTKN